MPELDYSMEASRTKMAVLKAKVLDNPAARKRFEETRAEIDVWVAKRRHGR